MYENKEVRMILAQSLNRVIGIKGKLPWTCPDDMKLFRALTHGCCVIMGRKTWESLPQKVRPLKGRKNIVISRTEGFKAEGATVCKSLDDALQHAPQPIIIIGGGDLYNQAMPFVDEIAVSLMQTIIDTSAYNSDDVVFAPEIKESEFGIHTVLAYPEKKIPLADGKVYTAPGFRHITYKRR